MASCSSRDRTQRLQGSRLHHAGNPTIYQRVVIVAVIDGKGQPNHTPRVLPKAEGTLFASKNGPSPFSEKPMKIRNTDQFKMHGLPTKKRIDSTFTFSQRNITISSVSFMRSS